LSITVIDFRLSLTEAAPSVTSAPLDAIVKENQEISADGSQVKVTGEAIQYESSVDRTALHKMNEGMVASPNGN